MVYFCRKFLLPTAADTLPGDAPQWAEFCASWRRRRRRRTGVDSEHPDARSSQAGASSAQSYLFEYECVRQAPDLSFFEA